VTSVRVVIDELVVAGWSRRRAERFLSALESELPGALQTARTAEVPSPRPIRGGGSRPEVAVTLERRDRRDPQRAAAAVAAAIARTVTEAARR